MAYFSQMSQLGKFRWVRYLLIALPLIIVSWQMYASNYRTLTRWKGGGYGMYTDSHGSYRSIVFVPADKNTIIHVYPLDRDRRSLLHDSLVEKYENSHRILKSTIFFPDWYEDRALQTEWLSRSELRNGDFYIYTTELKIDDRKIKNKQVFKFDRRNPVTNK